MEQETKDREYRLSRDMEDLDHIREDDVVPEPPHIAGPSGLDIALRADLQLPQRHLAVHGDDVLLRGDMLGHRDPGWRTDRPSSYLCALSLPQP